ncbi:MAG: DUF4145 domain-containing protein [Dehalococcoidia bacterium]|jgi:hypothetical protein
MKGVDGNVERFFCNSCQQKTRHVQRAVFTKRYEDEDEWVEGTWGIWECLGCEEVVLSRSWIYSIELPVGGGYEPDVTLYPQRSSGEAKKKEYENIPEQLDLIYDEIIRTFNMEADVLCSAGLRALLEAICLDREPSSRSLPLARKIDALRSSVPESIVKNLHGFRFLGNRALHELERPRRKDLALAISVMEDLLNAVYELDYRSADLYRRVSHDKERKAKENPDADADADSDEDP